MDKTFQSCQLLGTSYFVKIDLSDKDHQKISNGYTYIDIRDYGIDQYLKNPTDSVTEYDIERFNNILKNVELKNWEIQICCSGIEPDKAMGFEYLAEKVFCEIK